MNHILQAHLFFAAIAVINVFLLGFVFSLYKKYKRVEAAQNNIEEVEIAQTSEELVEEKEEICLENAIEEEKPEEVPEEVVAAIAAALAAMGYPMAQIASIRPRKQSQWKLDGRMHSLG